MTEPTRLGTPFEAQFHAGRAQEWIIQRLIRQINTAQLVRVLAVHPGDGFAGFVDVEPMQLQQSTTGVVIDGAPMYRLPYLRTQGGVSAIILDPVAGDIGLAVFAQRDISNVAATREPAAAATNRAYDAGDGVYVGGLLNATPTQYVEFLPEAAGINIVTPGDLSVEVAGDMSATIGGDLSVEVAGTISIGATSTAWRGPVTFADPITAPQATIGGIAFTTHKHIGAGPGNPTGTPIP